MFAFLVWFGAVFVQNIISALERVILLPFFDHLTTFSLLRPRRLPFPVSRPAACSILLWQLSPLSLLVCSKFSRMQLISEEMYFKEERCLSIALFLPSYRTALVLSTAVSSCITLISKFASVVSILFVGNSGRKLYSHKGPNDLQVSRRRSHVS